MKCPACDNPMRHLRTNGMEVEICEGNCGGVWFDNFELKRVDEAHETSGDPLLHIARNPELKVDMVRKRYCPKCEGQALRRHFSSNEKTVELDSCPNCGGCWLDAGELSQIREEYKTQADRKAATSKYFGRISQHLMSAPPAANPAAARRA